MSLSTSPSRTKPQWPCEVYSQRQTSVITTQVGVGLLQRPHRHLHDALVVVGARAGLVLGRRDPEQDHGAGPRPPAISSPRATSSEIEKRSTPGIDGDLLAHALAGDDEQRLDQVARARGRSRGPARAGRRVRRSRRMRVAGKLIADSSDFSGAGSRARVASALSAKRRSASRASTPYAATQDRARWRSGTRAPGPPRRAPPDIASSAGVEREQRADDLDHVEERRRSTVPDGTSERKAIGSETMNASSELARTSRAAAPIAAPKAAKPAPPATIATAIQSGSRPQSSRDEQRQPGEHQQRHRERDDDPEHDLLGEQRGRGRPGPRVSRAKAFSSRSSASEPGDEQHGDEHQRHRRGDRDRERVEARRRRRRRPPCRPRSAAATAPSSGVAKSRFWRARSAKRITSLEPLGSGLPCGSSARTASRICWAFSQPEDVERLAEQAEARRPRAAGRGSSADALRDLLRDAAGSPR